MRTDVLILGAGGAGLLGALHARKSNPNLSITIVVKGKLGETGCTRLSEGGLTVALGSDDSLERHLMDSLEIGKWLPDQELAWKMVTGARERFHELEQEFGCIFDRNADGSMHRKQFAGHSFDRTVHKGDMTGIAISDRLIAEVRKRRVEIIEEYRAVEFVKNTAGDSLAGVLLMSMTDGEFLFVQTQAVLLATGGGPTMYKYYSPSSEKTCDGMAMALRAGLALRDMEMIQFHPTGLMPSAGHHMAPILVEEALRNAGAHLLNSANERFMQKYDTRGECATRDIVSRSIFSEMRARKATAAGGALLSVQHMDKSYVREHFHYMTRLCAQYGHDLPGRGGVEVVPVAHYMMGGLVFDTDCRTRIPGLFAAGEDTGGVHGAMRLSGNGVADALVFGGVFGDVVGDWIKSNGAFHEPSADELAAAVAACEAPLTKSSDDIGAIRQKMYEVMWNDVGIERDAKSLRSADAELEELVARLDAAGIESGQTDGNEAWHGWLDLRSQLLVSRAISVAAIAREDSRGGHYRTDFPTMRDVEHSRYTEVTFANGRLDVASHPVAFTRVRPGESLARPSLPSSL